METEKKTIAVIDDDSPVRKAIKRFLKASGFVVYTFASGEEFLSAAASFTAHCLVLDVHLGTSSGFELVRHPLVTALDVPVVLMSASSDDSCRAQAEALGCAAFLSKPLSPPELLEAIGKALNA